MSFLALIAIVASVLSVSVTAAAAQANSIVINELHYHPATDPDEANDIDDFEFLELHNPTGSPVNISGWRIEDAFDLVFGDVVVAAGGYVVVSPSASATNAAYGLTPVGVYDGKLSNGGEAVTLLDAAGRIIDSVEYDDGGAWPESADGDGPSIELADPVLDHTLSSSWAASDPGPTPGAPNTAVPAATAISLPLLSPKTPTATKPVVISATIRGASSPVLTYRVAFGPDVAIPMSGSENDVFSANVPAQAPGELVRYRIDDADAASPPIGDSIRYWGYVVEDPEIDTSLPDFRWFIDPVAYNDMLSEHRFDDKMFPTVIAYDGVVYDGVVVRVRGGNYARTNYPKQSFEFEFPDGHDFVAPDLLDYPIDQFAMNSSWVDRMYGRNTASWDMFESAGFPKVQQFTARLEQNGEFYGLFQFNEKLDGEWRDAAGLDGGEFFKAAGWGFIRDGSWEVKSPKNASRAGIDEVGRVLRQGPSQAKTDYLYRTFDIANVVNWMAVSNLIGNWDVGGHNYYMFHDVDDTGLWQVYPWDVDQTMWTYYEYECDDLLEILRCNINPLAASFYEVPELEDMIQQRMRTLLDGPFQAALIEDVYNANIARIGSDGDREAAAWGRENPVDLAPGFTSEVAYRRNQFVTLADLPPAQAAKPAIVINELLPSPADGKAEVLELFNAGTTAVDVSGWELDGAGSEIAGGTVILPGGYLVLSDELANLPVSSLPNSTVTGQYSGGLKGKGETIRLITPEGVVVDQVTYSEAGPWPSVPDGYAYERIAGSSTSDTPLAWGTSAEPGGTPGRVNAPVEREWFAPGSPCHGLTPTHIGTDGNDRIVGTNGDDVIFAFAGDDIIRSKRGNDVVCAGDGNDKVFGGSGINVLHGEAGADWINTGVGAAKLYGGDGNDELYGGSSNDRLLGGGGHDYLFGGGGRDVLQGGRGADELNGGANIDRLSGNSGADLLHGGTGKDQLRGNSGNDRLFGGGGDDLLLGGPGVDTGLGGAGSNTCKVETRRRC